MIRLSLTLFAFAFFVAPLSAQVPLEKDHAEKMARGLDIFKKQVKPLLIQHCLKCHGGEKTEGELDITDRDKLLKGGDHGAAFVPNEPSKSLLFKMVTHEKKPVMPYKEAKLPAEAIKHLSSWIENGAPYDSPLIARKDVTAWTQKVIAPELKQHWAYLPIKRPALPKVQNEKWLQTPLDRFILEKLEAKSLAPNSATSKKNLLRRAYFDLIGLPPTPEEVDAFLKDESPQAFSKVLDKLLASPQYGERWARHWLDLARFAESHGFEHDYDRATAYHYRDFVIKALNQGLPYDTFIKWQLAGDEIAPNNPLALMATGFLAAGVHSTQITKNEVEKHRYDELDDILNTTGTAMLGLSVGCARCHDHKYDAIPQRDYYRMLSTFTTTIRSEMDLDLEPENYKKAKAAFDLQLAPYVSALEKFEKEQLPARFAEWEKTNPPSKLSPTWELAEIASMKSSGGATLTKKEDGSVLISGKNPPIETLTFVLNTDMQNIRSLRLEALSDPSLVKGGPGRAGNGNFCLTDIRVSAAPKKGGASQEIKLLKPRSTFDQKGLGVAAAIDADPVTSGWAIDPQFGKNHAAAFDLEKPIGDESGTVLTITMKFHNNAGHGMGRPRISLTNASDLVDIKATSVPEALKAAMAAAPEKRTPQQKTLLINRYKTLDKEWVKLNQQVQDHLAKAPKPSVVKVLVSSEGLPPIRLHSQGEDFLKETHFLKRGDPNQKDGVASMSFLQVAMEKDDPKPWAVQPPMGSRLSYRRTAFANWITDVENGGGRLLARVIVNRLWQHHLGRGIVSTPSDFGVRGEKPTHPELLDYLASELIANGWQLKPIHKLIMSSSVYATSSTLDEAKQKIDRDNMLFWRRPAKRLEAEAIRDSLLYVSGSLDTKMYGPGNLDEASKRRSVYFTMKRSRLIPMLVIFDAPDGTVGVGERTATIAPQSLYLMNNAHVRGWAKSFAKRLTTDPMASLDKMIHQAYRIALAREASPDELQDGLAFVQQQQASYQGKADARDLALADFCQVLLCLNEFIFVE